MQTIGLIAFLPYLGLSRDEKASGLGHRVLDECKRTFQRGDSNYAEKQRHNFYQLLNQNPSKEVYIKLL
jgi:hypothetical protein